jgi:hypothetical protein
MSFWAKIKLITSNIWTFIEPTVRWLGSKTGMILTNAAMTAIKQVAANPEIVKKGNLAMRQAAFDIIVTVAKQEGKQLGIDFLEHQVNKAIEDAVFNNKAEEEGK